MFGVIDMLFNYRCANDEIIEKISCTPSPIIIERFAKEDDTSFTKLSIKKLPLLLKNTIIVKIDTNRRHVTFTLNPFNFDGATYWKVLRIFLGSNTKKEYRKASAIHDYFINNKKYIYDNILKRSLTIPEFRRLTSLVFRCSLIEQGVDKKLAYVMAFFVHLWQTFMCKRGWNL